MDFLVAPDPADDDVMKNLFEEFPDSIPPSMPFAKSVVLRFAARSDAHAPDDADSEAHTEALVSTKTACLFPVLKNALSNVWRAQWRASDAAPAPGFPPTGDSIPAAAAPSDANGPPAPKSKAAAKKRAPKAGAKKAAAGAKKPPSENHWYDDLGRLVLDVSQVLVAAGKIAPAGNKSLTREHFAVALNRVSAPVLTPQEDAWCCRMLGLELLEEVDFGRLVKDRALEASRKRVAGEKAGVVGGTGGGHGGNGGGTGKRPAGMGGSGGASSSAAAGTKKQKLEDLGTKIMGGDSIVRDRDDAAADHDDIQGRDSAASDDFRFPHEVLEALGIEKTELQRVLFAGALPPESCWRDAQGRQLEVEKSAALPDSIALISMHRSDGGAQPFLDEDGDVVPDWRPGNPPVVGFPADSFRLGGVTYGIHRGRGGRGSGFDVSRKLSSRDDAVVVQRNKPEKPDPEASLWPQKLREIWRSLKVLSDEQQKQARRQEKNKCVFNETLCGKLLQLRFGAGARFVLAGGSVFKAFMGQNLGSSDLDFFLVSGGDRCTSAPSTVQAQMLAAEVMTRVQSTFQALGLEVLTVQRSVCSVTWYFKGWIYEWSSDFWKDLWASPQVPAWSFLSGAATMGEKYVRMFQKYVKLEEKTLKLQVLGLFPNISSVLDSFDFSCCQIGMTDTEVVATPAAFASLGSGLVVVGAAPFEWSTSSGMEDAYIGAKLRFQEHLGKMTSSHYLKRILKYSKRGMGVVLAAGVAHQQLRGDLGRSVGRGMWSARLEVRRKAKELVDLSFKKRSTRERDSFSDQPEFFAAVVSACERYEMQKEQSTSDGGAGAPFGNGGEGGVSSYEGLSIRSEHVDVDVTNFLLWKATGFGLPQHVFVEDGGTLQVYGGPTDVYFGGDGVGEDDLPKVSVWQKDHGISYFVGPDAIVDVWAHGPGNPLTQVSIPPVFKNVRKLFPSGKMPVPDSLATLPVFEDRAHGKPLFAAIGNQQKGGCSNTSTAQGAGGAAGSSATSSSGQQGEDDADKDGADKVPAQDFRGSGVVVDPPSWIDKSGRVRWRFGDKTVSLNHELRAAMAIEETLTEFKAQMEQTRSLLARRGLGDPVG